MATSADRPAMTGWKQVLKADPLQWLLQPECAPVRYGTLLDLSDHAPADAELRAARAALVTYPPVAELLSAQARDGYWDRPDYYLPRAGRGTFWVLTVLGDLGLTAEEEPIRRASEWIFTHQRDNGPFCRRRRVPGRGVVWATDVEPCTHARIVRFLVQFGYASDPRVRRAIDWLLPGQRGDGMWLCFGPGERGCMRATLDVLRVAALDPETARRPGIAQAAEVVCARLMEPRMSRYHVGEAWGTWQCLKYPYFGISLLSALDALARLRNTLDHQKIAAAVEYLLGRQLPDGTWPLDEAWPHPPLDFGRPGEPNKWLTLDALRVVKAFFGRMQNDPPRGAER